MSAFRAGTWPEVIEFNVALARLAVAGGPEGAEHVEAVRERALALAAEAGMLPTEALKRVEADCGVLGRTARTLP